MRQSIQHALGFLGLWRSRETNIVQKLEAAVFAGDTQQVNNILIDFSDDEMALLMYQVSPSILVKPATDNKLDILVMLLSVATPDRQQDFISYNAFLAPRMAAEKGHANAVAMFFRQVHPLSKHTMVSFLNFAALRLSAKNGNKPMVELLLQEDYPVHKQIEIAFDHYSVFRIAAKHGHMNIVKLLLKEIDPRLKQAMLKAHNSGAIREAVSSCKTQIVELLLHEADPIHSNILFLTALSTSVESIAHKQTTPLILAYADPRLCPTGKWLNPSDNLQNMTNRVNSYRDLIAQGVHEFIDEIASQRAQLNTVCKITSMFANRNLPIALLTHVCTFLGIPNFAATPVVVIPQSVTCTSLVLRHLENSREELKFDGRRLL